MTLEQSLLARLDSHRGRTLVADGSGEYTGAEILASAACLARKISASARQGRVALLANPGIDCAAGLFAVWLRGAMCVPLCPEHPAAELEHVLRDSGACAVLCSRALSPRLPPTRPPVIEIGPRPTGGGLGVGGPAPLPSQSALMLYTSGTTGKPKGVVHTHGSLSAQVRSLVEAWEWKDDDRILHFLPLHHIHGIVNKFLCPLWAGAHCEMLPGFEAQTVWRRIAAGGLTVFMAVPTVYAKLIRAWEQADPGAQARWSAACGRMRVMVSGSAALPVSLLDRWRAISGHVLLERYGMTEIGMAISNPLHGERRPGCVGRPLPGVQVRLAGAPGEAEGELQVRAATLFKEYWGRPEETCKSFTEDGWFKTGDWAACADGTYRILGRISTDIIKCGGYKISALEIESVLLQHPSIAECGVVGVPDETWGERVAAALVLKGREPLTLEDLRAWAKDRLAAYKLPTRLKIVARLPGNAMGKALKGEVRRLFA
ncbi:MAG: acyl-CoA synthetase [Elusimicrobia bacterium]|nr:acyl-CoA synthetase [Elusimicrobiota bacterium]